MVTVKQAGALAGYTHESHLIDDDEIPEVIGQSYANGLKALQAVKARCSLRGKPYPYVWCELIWPDGSTTRIQSV